jgi:hypothetical protein
MTRPLDSALPDEPRFHGALPTAPLETWRCAAPGMALEVSLPPKKGPADRRHEDFGATEGAKPDSEPDLAIFEMPPLAAEAHKETQREIVSDLLE